MAISRPRARAAGAALVAVLALAVRDGRSAQPAFFPDDPIAVDPETQDAKDLAKRVITDPFDFVENTFLRPGDRTSQRALNVNTIDEVPASSWFTDRAGARVLTADEVARGPNEDPEPAPGPWEVISGKGDGITPGFTVRDTAGVVWFIKFDPPSNPEMATGAEMVSTKLFWALGYNVPQNHLVTLRQEELVIAPTATIRDTTGTRRKLTSYDIEALLRKAPRREDGGYRAIASRGLPGRDLGPFKYFGTRPEDPNDLFPHEHRRELRGMRVFSAWLNHDDSRSINSIDVLVDRGPRKIVQHYLIDFGSTLGSGSVQAQKPRAGNEYLWEARPTLATMLSLGFWVRPWIRVRYPEYPSLGNLEAAFFQPDRWKPEYPNVAFDRARPDDLFWAARRVMNISDEAIRAAVGAAEYSDHAAADYLGDVIIARRDKVGLQWLTGVNPLVDFALDPQGVLTFRNLAVDTRRASPPQGYTVEWARFDNATGTATPVARPRPVEAMRDTLPPGLRDVAYVQAEVHTTHPAFPAWSAPVTVQFRKVTGGWQLVGLRRAIPPA
jgi:hypothetical protein